MLTIDTSQNKKSKRMRPRRVKVNDMTCQSIYIDGNILPDCTWNKFSIQNISNFLQERQIQIQNHQTLIKSNCKKVASWGWEMLETLLVMVETFKGLSDQMQVCLKRVPKSSDFNQDSEQPGLSNRKKDYILVLDLDETLIHSNIKRQNVDDYEVTIDLGKNSEKYFVRKRPFMETFLEKMAELFDIYIFTAALKEYADQVLDWIDPKGLIQKRFYRDSCTKINGVFCKDLKKVHENMSNVFIIDNSTSGFSMNPENGMLIKSWYFDPSDDELKQYQKFLSEGVAKRKFKGNITQALNFLKGKYPLHVLN